MKTVLSFVTASSLLAMAINPVIATAADRESLLQEAIKARQQAYATTTTRPPNRCLDAPFPTTPVGQSWSMPVKSSFLGIEEDYELTAWRHPCTETVNQLLVTLRPKATNGYSSVFSPFGIAQGDQRYNVLAYTGNDRSQPLSDGISRPVTVVLETTGNQSIDENGEMDIEVLLLGANTAKLHVPAADAAPPPFVIDGRVRGAYTDNETTGHGFFFDYHLQDGQTKTLVGGWGTASPLASDKNAHEWYVFSGTIYGDTAEVSIHRTRGQVFGQATSIESVEIGTGYVTFTDCEHAEFLYTFHAPYPQMSGKRTLRRLTHSPEGCGQPLPVPEE
jgi:hypothetical protein